MDTYQVHSKRELLELLTVLMREAKVAGNVSYTVETPQATILWKEYKFSCKYTVSLSVATIDRMQRRLKAPRSNAMLKKGKRLLNLAESL